MGYGLRDCIEVMGCLNNFLGFYLDHCLDDLVRPLGNERRHALDEFKEITRCP